MKRYFVGLDVSKVGTVVCRRHDRGDIVMSSKKPTLTSMPAFLAIIVWMRALRLLH